MEKIASDHRAGREPAQAAQSGSEQTAVPGDLVSSRILRLSNILRRGSTLVYNRRFGLSQIEWRILALVGEQAPISLNALAELMALDKGQVSRGVSALVVRRLLLREYRREGRGVAITLATHGAEVYRELTESALERNNVLLQGLSDAEKRRFFALLDRLTDAARGILLKEQGLHGLR